MTRDDLVALRERVRAASGADESLDADIHVALGWTPQIHERGDERRVRWAAPDNQLLPWTWEPSPITASLDAALALVERVLPGWQWHISSARMGQKPEAVLHEPLSRHVQPAYCATHSLAICDALLSALTKGPTHD